MSQKRIQPFHSGLSTKTSAKDKSALDLLGAYIMSDDSDDEKKEKISTESSLDYKVSNFLKEIEDLDTKTSSSQKPKRKDVLNSSKKEEKLNWGLWKQCKDESTGYPYYWNTKTNEVSWSLPERISETCVNTKIKLENDVKVPAAQKRTNGTEQKHEPLNKKQKTTEVENKTNSITTFVNKDLDVDLVSKIQQKRLKLKMERQMHEQSKLLKKEDLSTKTTEKALDILASQKIPDKKSSIENKIISKVSAKLSNTFGDLLKETREETRKLQSLDAKNSSHDNKEEQTKEVAHNVMDYTQKKQVDRTSKLIQDKLKCLNATNKQMSICQKLYIQLQVRMLDWNSGQLSNQYMSEKLQSTEEALKEYERSQAPKGWNFLWNSQLGRYHYSNETSGETQWDCPLQTSTTTSPITTSDGPDLTDQQPAHSGPVDVKEGSDEDEKDDEKSLWMPTSSLLPPLPPGEDLNVQPPLPSCEQPPQPPPPSEDPPDMHLPVDLKEMSAEEMEISDQEDIKPSDTWKISSEITSGPVDYSCVPVHFSATVSNLPVSSNTSVPVSVDSDGQATKEKVKKFKKTRKPVKKPPKQVSGLMAKWKKAKNEIDEEMKRIYLEAEKELDEEQDKEKKIENWLAKQVKTGKTAGNANFEPVGDAWKLRLKKKKNVSR